MLIRRLFLPLVILSLSAVLAQAQVTEKPQRLESGKPVERATSAASRAAITLGGQ